MFYYWDGFEIDGSDTDYDLVLPETQQRIDFVKCFLSMPVLLPWVCIYEPGTRGMKDITIAEALRLVETGRRRYFICKLWFVRAISGRDAG